MLCYIANCLQGVSWIMRARAEFNKDNNPRAFQLPTLNFDARDYTTMIDWTTAQCTEPPLTMAMSDSEVEAIIKTPYNTLPFPNHTQAVERAVRVVTEVAQKRSTKEGRDKMIANVMESRRICRVFKSKQDGLPNLDS